MPGNSHARGRAGGRKGTTAGTAPRPEGCSRARRRRTGAGRTGSGGREICASQCRAAPTKATLLPPLSMSLSVMSGASDRTSRCDRFWMPVVAADGQLRLGPDTGFLRKRDRALPWPGSASVGFAARARHAVSRGLRVRRGCPGPRRTAAASGPCTRHAGIGQGRDWRQRLRRTRPPRRRPLPARGMAHRRASG
jgi:hypothetical protein